MKRLFLLAVAAALMTLALPVAGATGDLIVDGTNYGQPDKANQGTRHWYTPTPNPKKAHVKGGHTWNGKNGKEHLPCDGLVHWVENKSRLVISHCEPGNTTTTSSTISTTTTTQPTTTTTEVPPSTTTTLPPDPTTTTSTTNPTTSSTTVTTQPSATTSSTSTSSTVPATTPNVPPTSDPASTTTAPTVASTIPPEPEPQPTVTTHDPEPEPEPTRDTLPTTGSSLALAWPAVAALLAGGGLLGLTRKGER